MGLSGIFWWPAGPCVCLLSLPDPSNFPPHCKAQGAPAAAAAATALAGGAEKRGEERAWA